jgi:hypothetical protein
MGEHSLVSRDSDNPGLRGEEAMPGATAPRQQIEAIRAEMKYEMQIGAAITTQRRGCL